MHTKLSFTFVYGFSILFSSLTTIARPGICDKEYYDYLEVVVEHIKVQSGWSSMKHIKIVDFELETDLSIEEHFQLNLSDHNILIAMFNQIAELVNCRYAEILKIFSFQLTTVAKDCNYFNQGESYENVMRCAVLLQDIINHSAPLFEKLYAALTFLSMIDVKFLHLTSYNYAAYIVDQLYYAKNYVSSMAKANLFNFTDNQGNIITGKILDFLESVMEFCLDITKKLNGIPPLESKVVMYSKVEVNFKQIYQKKYSDVHSNFVDFMSAKIKKFLDDAMQNDFINLGFTQLLEPTSTRQDVNFFILTFNNFFRVFLQCKFSRKKYISI